MKKSFGGAWLNKYEYMCKYDIAESFVEPYSISELCSVAQENEDVFSSDLMHLTLTYGEHRCGFLPLRTNISNIYKKMKPENILTSHASVGANQLIFSFIKENFPNCKPITIIPTYQQLRSLPEMMFENLIEYELNEKNQFSLDFEEVEKMVDYDTKLIIMCNPNNPFGKLFSESELMMLSEIARRYDCYILCDEIYSDLGVGDIGVQTYICDVYEKGISTCSLSKTYSCPGLRIGWLATQSKELIQEIADIRHYCTMENSIICEKIASLVIKNRDRVIQRNKKIVDENYLTLCEWIKNNPELRFSKPQSGSVIVIYYTFDIDSMNFAKILVEEYGVLTMPGIAYGLEGCFRIGLVLQPNKFKEALEEISKFIDKLRNSN